MKKNYKAPITEIYKVKVAQMICGSVNSVSQTEAAMTDEGGGTVNFANETVPSNNLWED